MNTSMVIQTQLLATKFFVPTFSRTLISRPRLTGLLAESLKYHADQMLTQQAASYSAVCDIGDVW